MRSHLLIRMTAATALLTGVAAGAVATASPAGAIQQCTGGYTLAAEYGVTSAPSVYVEDYLECNSAPFSIPEPVNISKYVGGVGWEVVASAQGYVNYACTGGKFLYTTSVTTAQGKPAFYCG